jgi:NADH-quinone oxidoreductase subunit L
MSRLFVLTFRGQERFREVTHDHDPHESPWLMTVPLVILALLAMFGGVLDLPWIHHDSIAGFISISIADTSLAPVVSDAAQWALAAVDVLAALIGLVAAFSIWRRTSPWPTRYESSFFERVWRWDDFYDASIGRPLEHAAAFTGDVIEPKVIDGAVGAVAISVRRSAEGLRKVQSGFLRHYALATVFGLAVIVVFLLMRSW